MDWLAVGEGEDDKWEFLPYVWCTWSVTEPSRISLGLKAIYIARRKNEDGYYIVRGLFVRPDYVSPMIPTLEDAKALYMLFEGAS